MAPSIDEQDIQRLWNAGRDACPGVELSLERFTVRLRKSEAGAEVSAGDFYLACACAEGLPAALERFDAQILTQVPTFVSQLRLDPDAVEDVRQLVRTRLFVGS